ncbi:MAG: hypothetical protein LBE61_00735 [Burkholderiaceae bacterium]|jgi:hypothetical protein|nr:hypothetical protein [Burkholderiaceae bacterium]
MPTLRTICASLLLAGACTATFAQSCAPGQWLAEYFPNIALSGAPVLSRCEDGPINHYWGGAEGSPDPARLPVDGFSARWTGTLPFEAGPAKFITFTDDGVRVFVDGQNVIDNWTLHGVTMDVATLPMTAGQHTVRMEYFEGGGDGLAQFVIEQDRVSTPTDPTDPGDPGPNPNPNPEPQPRTATLQSVARGGRPGGHGHPAGRASGLESRHQQRQVGQWLLHRLVLGVFPARGSGHEHDDALHLRPLRTGTGLAAGRAGG